jgi:hypothetical protein
MDEIIANGDYGNGQRIDGHTVQDFINRFCKVNEKGYIFTLNQDLLLERNFFNFWQVGPPTIPGVPLPTCFRGGGRGWFLPNLGKYSSEFDVKVPTDFESVDLSNGLNYLKLHGSFNWIDTDDHRLMIMGVDKSSKIISSPLLKNYSEIFRDILFSGDIRLMIYGYSFGDNHINDVLSTAAEKHNLKTYIWNTMPSIQMRNVLDGSSARRSIWQSLIGYTSLSLNEAFTCGRSGHCKADEICEAFFRD